MLSDISLSSTCFCIVLPACRYCASNALYAKIISSSAVCIQVSHDFQGSDLHVEGVSVLYFVDLQIVDHFPEEPGHPTLCRFKTGIFIDKVCMCGL